MVALQHGFTVEPTADPDLNRLQQRIKKALDTLAAAATGSQLTDDARFVVVGSQYLQNEKRGPDIASAATVAVTTGYHRITGTTNVLRIATGGWFDGARVELYVANGLTFVHNGGGVAGSYQFSLSTLANVTIAAGGRIAFRRDDALQHWVQVG